VENKVKVHKQDIEQQHQETTKQLNGGKKRQRLQEADEEKKYEKNYPGIVAGVPTSHYQTNTKKVEKGATGRGGMRRLGK